MEADRYEKFFGDQGGGKNIDIRQKEIAYEERKGRFIIFLFFSSVYRISFVFIRLFVDLESMQELLCRHLNPKS